MTDIITKAPTIPPTLELDWEVYAQALEGSNLSDDEKRELIEIMWSIVVSFVDLGYGVHPVQQACEQVLTIPKNDDADVVSSPHNQSTSEFNKTANPRADVTGIETVLGTYLKGAHHVQPPA